MNKNCYRIVFNKVRGLLMAVAETVVSHGKAAGTTSGNAAAPTAGQGDALLATVRALTFGLWAALGLVMWPAAGYAQIVADPNAPGNQRPTILNAANGVPQVNIQTPSAAGVSRNTYSQFDVQQQGAILNNSRTNVQTQLGGWVQGNPWLATGTARVILNEVNSSNPSRLRGYVEVAGDRAQVVIANPAGLTCDGCGFINANRATLTTGTPIVNGGNLDGFRVQGGAITITGAGLDASHTDYTDLIARSLQINAGIWANQLRLTAGANQVKVDNNGDAGQVTAIAGAAPAPAFAIDVAQLGGMYAGKIMLIGTEAGVGVRNAGKLGATGDLIVTAEGRLENSGSMQAQGTIQIKGESLVNSGQIAGGTEALLSLQNDVNNSQGTIQAPRIELNAANGSINNAQGKIVQTGSSGFDINALTLANTQGGLLGTPAPLPGSGNAGDAGSGAGTGGGAGNPSSSSSTDNGNGSGATPVDPVSPSTPPAPPVVIANGIIHAAGAIDNSAGTITASGNINLSVAGLDNSGGKMSLNTLSVDGKDFSNRLGTLTVRHDFNVHAVNFANTGGSVLVGDGFNVQVDQFDNASGLLQADHWQMSVGQGLNNTQGTLRFTGSQTAVINVGGELINQSGTVEAPSGLQVNAGSITGGGKLNTQGDLTLNSGKTSAQNAAWTIGGNAWLHTAGLENSGIISVGKNLNIKGAALNNRDGKLSAGANIAIDASDAVDNTNGYIQAGKDLQLTAAGSLDNSGGVVEAIDVASAMTIQAQAISNNAGRIGNVGSALTSVNSNSTITSSGLIAGNGNVSIAAQKLNNMASGKIVAAGNLDLAASAQSDNAGSINSGGAFNFRNTNAAFNNSGQIVAGATATISAAAVNNDGGQIATAKGSGANLALSSQSLSNRSGQILADGDATVTASGAVDNNQGILQAGGNMRLTAGTSAQNNGGVIEALGPLSTLTLQAQTIGNGNGRINNVGNGATAITSYSGLSNAGTIASNGDLQLNALTLQNLAGGAIASGGDLNLGATQQLNNQGNINATGTLTFNQASANFSNSGKVISGGNAVIVANVVNNDGGQLETAQGSAADLTLTSQTLSNQGGHIVTDRDLVVTTHAMQGIGELFGGRDLTLTMDGNYTQTTQQLHSNRDLSLTVTGNITNTSTLEAVRNLSLSGNTITNQAGAVIQGQSITAKAVGNLSNAGEINGTDTVNLSAANIDNSNTITGGKLTLTAQNLNNTGSQALIGSIGDMALRVANQLNNTDGATIYSAGNLSIGATPAGGSTALVNNHSSTIEAAGDLSLAAVTLNNVRDNVSIVKVTTVDETVQMYTPSWYVRGGNNAAYETTASNYRPHEVYYVNPADILENTTVVTPDGQTIGRAVIRTHANDSAFFSATTGGWGAFAHSERIQMGDGTRVIYYTSSSSNQANPDQGGPPEAAWNYISSNYWSGPLPTLSSQYGSCTTNCLRLVTQPGYDDPTHTIIIDTVQAHGVDLDDIEDLRSPRHVAMEDRIASGAGQVAQIRSGRNMHLTVAQTLNNQYGNVMATGNLAIDGSADIVNEGATLYRTHTFGGTWHTPQGDVVAYSHPSISEVIGSAKGIISGGQSVSISGRSFTNVDVTAGTAVNIRSAVTVIGSGANNQTQAGSTANAGNTIGVGAQAIGSASAGGNTVKISPSALFVKNPDAHGQYLLETRSQFANQRDWLSSDYLLNQLNMDPSLMQKRLGDGFYEQRLVREQLAELTGRAPSDGASDDSRYQTLLSNAVGYAKQWSLRPGIDLTPEQVSQLTSDIVWLVSETVTLPDGTTETVLAPKVYLAHHLDENAVKPGGALVTGGSVDIRTDNIVNRGGVIDSGNGRTVLVAQQDIVNQGGTISGDTVLLAAGRDVKNETLTKTETFDSAATQASYTSLSNQAAISAKGSLAIVAGNDVTDLAGNIKAGDASIAAGRDISFGTVQTGSAYHSEGGDGVVNSSSLTHQTSQISTTGSLALQAGQDLKLAGTQVAIGGDGLLAAGRNLSLDAVTDESSSSVHSKPNDKGYAGYASQNQTVKGAAVDFGGNLTMAAGTAQQGSLTVTAGTVSGAGNLALAASGNVTIQEAMEKHSSDWVDHHESSNVLSSKSSIDSGHMDSNLAIGSSLSGNAVSIVGGGDVLVRGSSVAATQDLTLAAAGNVDIVAAQSTRAENQFHESSQSGLMGGGGLSVSIGSRDQSSNSDTVSTQAVSSMVGSTDGDVHIRAGKNYTQTGSQVLALAGDIGIAAQKVDINAATETSNSAEEQRISQSGLSVSLSSSLVSSLQTGQQMVQAAQKTSDPRMQALAAANTAFAAKGAYDGVQALAKDPSSLGGAKVSASIGSSRSESSMTQHSNTAVGSTVAAGGDVRISAVGGGEDSNITAIGSMISAGNNVDLMADNKINLLAAQNTADQKSNNSSNGASIGVGFAMGGSQNGFTLELGANKGRGHADGTDTVYTNTQVKAGNAANLQSGSDTTLKGAVVAANTVTADIGGNLSIESLQDTSKFDSKQSSAGIGVSVCVPPFCYGNSSVSGSLSNAKVNGDYASVVEQSGIKAGDGGFQVTVKGNTDLKGGVIASTDKAVQDNRNSLTTATLTHSDIENRDVYEAEGYSVSASVSGKFGDQGSAPPGKDQTAADESKNPARPGASAGVGSASGSQSSVTKSGISAGAITITDEAQQKVLTGQGSATTIASVNTGVTTDKDTSGALSKAWNGTRLQEEVQAQVAITQVFSQNAPKAVGDYASKQIASYQVAQASAEAAQTVLVDANATAEQKSQAQALLTASQEVMAQQQETYDHWKEGGDYRVALHTAAGAVGGGVAGATGAAVTASAAPLLNKLQDNAEQALIEQGMSPGAAKMVAQGLAEATSAGMGATVSGVQGAATGLAVDTNNRQLHPSEVKWIQAKATGFAKQLFGTDTPTDQQIAQAKTYLTLAAMADVDKGDQNASMLLGLNKDEKYNAAKEYLIGQKDTFVNDKGQNQRVFTVQGNEFYDPLKYSNYNADPAYRDFMWNTVGVNYAPPVNASPQEKALYAQREQERLLRDLKSGLPSLITAGVLSGVSRIPGKVTTSVVSSENSSTAPKVFNGIELDPRLPPPVAGYDYSPNLVKGAATENQAFSHWTGAQAEAKLANEVVGQGQVVVKWGDKIGAQGNDIISVDPKTGEVILWDSKYRSSGTAIQQSSTFANAGTRANAIEEAQNTIRMSNLSDAAKNQALQNLDKGNFTTNTVGSGGAKNSVQVRYCGNKPC